MRQAFIFGVVRSPIGRLNGGLAGIRANDLAAVPVAADDPQNMVLADAMGNSHHEPTLRAQNDCTATPTSG